MHHEEFDSTLAKLRPVIGDMADAFWLGALLDPARREDLEAVARAMAAELLDESYVAKHILLEPPEQDKAKGEYPLGTVVYADRHLFRFCLREVDLPQHIAVLGRSGAGKTNVAYVLVWNLLRKRKPFVVLDWRGTYRHFLSRPEGGDLLVFTLGDEKSLSFNPLQPPPGLGRSQSEAYIRDIVSTVVTTYLPGYHLLSTRGVEYFLLKALQFLRAGGDRPATFSNVRDYMERYHADSREMDWKVSALNVLFKLTTGPIGRLMNPDGATALAQVLNRPVILELPNLGSETDRAMFTRTFLLWLYYLRLAEGKSPAFKHAVIVEEAHNLFLRRPGGEESVSDLMLRQMRELGEALVLLDQNPSLLTVPSLGNTGVTICLNLKHGDDVEAAGKALTLPREQWEHIGRLPVGQGIVKLQDRWVKPFLVGFPRFPAKSGSPPHKEEGRHSGCDLVRRSIEELRLALDEAGEVLRDVARGEDKKGLMSMEERSMLLDIAGNPLSVVTERYGRLGWNVYAGTAVKRMLLEKGLIEQEKVSVPHGSVALLKVTEAGKGLLASCGVQVKALPKNASLEHEYWKTLTAERYRAKGYTVEEEVPIGGGRAVDLVASKEGRRIAIEIETGKSDVEGNVRKCKDAGFETVISMPTGKLNGRTAG
jgi:hypothetical protein